MAALPRVVGAFDSFWLDEIWSLELAARAATWTEVFTDLHHDNNHYLNTLWLRMWGPDAAWILYRLPALLAGIGAVFLAGWMELGVARTEAVLASLAVGVSYPFVHYSTEARGYGLVVILALASFALLRRHHREGDTASAAAFAAVAALGFVAHLTFLTVYLPLLAWSAWVGMTRWDGGRTTVRLAGAHLAPILVLTFLMLVDIRYMVRGGGPVLPPMEGWVGAWSYALGVPVSGMLARALLAAFLAVGALGALDFARRDEGSWVFFSLVFAFPVALLLALRTAYAPPRYFLVSLAPCLLLVSRGLARGLGGRSAARGAAVALLVAFTIGNGWLVYRFLADGRGDHRTLVEHLAQRTGSDTIRVAGDYDPVAGIVLRYYERYLLQPRVVEYVPEDGTIGEPVAWYLLHEQDDDFDPPREIASPELPTPGGRGRYLLERVFPKFGLSGWNWALYRWEEDRDG